MDEMIKKATEELKEPKNALEFLKEIYSVEFDGPDCLPVKVVQVLDVYYAQSVHNTKRMVKAICECIDGRMKIITASCNHYKGSNIDPPEDETNFSVEIYKTPIENANEHQEYGQEIENLIETINQIAVGKTVIIKTVLPYDYTVEFKVEEFSHRYWNGKGNLREIWELVHKEEDGTIRRTNLALLEYPDGKFSIEFAYDKDIDCGIEVTTIKVNS